MKKRMKQVPACYFIAVLLTGALADLQTPVIAVGIQESLPIPTAQLPSPQLQNQAADSKQRQQAYLHYLEAQRLKGEIHRVKSRRLLEDAIKAYTETIRLDPEAADPHVDLGELYLLYMDRRELAEKEALEAIRLSPNDVGGHLLLGRTYITHAKKENSPRSPNIDRAISEYEKVTELDSGQAEAWALLAELYKLKNDTDRRIHALEKWASAPLPNDTFFYRTLMNVELTPDLAYIQLSQLYRDKGKNRQAIEAARRAYEMDQDSNSYARNLISILRAAGTSADELRIYSQLVKSANSPAILIGYGSALVRAGLYVEATDRLREYVAADPSNVSAVGLLALAQRRSNQRPAAIETLKAGISRAEAHTRVELTIELAETYEELGRDEEAITQYELAFESFLIKGALTQINTLLFGEVVNRLVRVSRRAGNRAMLQSVLTRTRRVVDEHNPLIDLIAIESLREDGKRREALELAQTSSRRYPDDRAIKFNEALILNEMKRFKEAAQLLRGMIKGSPELATDDAGVYLILSNVQMQSGELKAAEESARKALELNPDDGDILIQLSSVLDRAERHHESEKILRDLLKRDPDNATALNNLGYFFLERGERYDEALKLIVQAIAIEPINGSFLDSLGWAHYKLGNIERALEHLEKAMFYSRRNSTIHEHLGDVLRNMGRVNEARRNWEKALEYSIEADEITRIKVKLIDAR
jgi:tetratricopeptide (TPR) repeat protein